MGVVDLSHSATAREVKFHNILLSEMIYDKRSNKQLRWYIKEITVGNITRDVLHSRDQLEIEQNVCQHQIFWYVQCRYGWKKSKGQNYQMRLNHN